MNKTAKNDSVANIIDSAELLGNAQDINNVLTVAKVQSIFQGHYFNLENDSHGIAFLIAEILKEREAVFPKGIETSELRQVAIATSMYASDIIEEVHNRFTAGSSRYPYETVHAYLSIFMNADNKKQLRSVPKIGQIKLTNNEDKPRPCFKPRCKYYLVQE